MPFTPRQKRERRAQEKLKEGLKGLEILLEKFRRKQYDHNHSVYIYEHFGDYITLKYNGCCGREHPFVRPFECRVLRRQFADIDLDVTKFFLVYPGDLTTTGEEIR